MNELYDFIKASYNAGVIPLEQLEAFSDMLSELVARKKEECNVSDVSE